MKNNPEPYKIKSVESIYRSSREERESWIKKEHYNLFNLASRMVYIDLLTDSGTGAMSDQQWSAIMSGDESYAGSESYINLRSTVREVFGFPFFLPTHQGRAAENVLFSVLVKEGNLVPGNAHFDTTKGHIEYRKAKAVDCTIDEAYDTTLIHPFKGNVDLTKLDKTLRDHGDQVPFIVVTITCNTAGGQPVSMQNLKDVYQLAKKYNKLVLIDSARFAENAWFIKTREPAYSEKSIPDIVLEMYGYADLMTMSAKKDGIVNIGGFIGFKDEGLYQESSTFSIMFEGFMTYGGMAGRDMAALAVGLHEICSFEYLSSRIGQVEELGNLLVAAGVPVIQPFGGHAIFLDAVKFLPHVSRDQYTAQTLAIELYCEGGIRAVEIGTIMADRDPTTRQDRFPNLELVRLAIPRRVYTSNHLAFVAECIIRVYHRREKISKGYRIVREAPILRHFTVELEPVE